MSDTPSHPARLSFELQRALTIAVQLGIVVLSNRLAFMYDQRGSMAWWLRAGAVTSLLAIACQETVEFSLQMPGNAVLFTIICAIALHNPADSDDPAEEGEEVNAGEPRLRLATAWSAPLGTAQASSRSIRLEFARRNDRR